MSYRKSENLVNYDFDVTLDVLFETKVVKFYLKVRKDDLIPEFDFVDQFAWDTSDKFDEVQIQLFNSLGDYLLAEMGVEITDLLDKKADDIEKHLSDFVNISNFQTYLGIPKSLALEYLKVSGQKDRYKRATERIICRCKRITNHQIAAYLSKSKFTDSEELYEAIRGETGAGTGCNSCCPSLKKIAGDYLEKKKDNEDFELM